MQSAVSFLMLIDVVSASRVLAVSSKTRAHGGDQRRGVAHLNNCISGLSVSTLLCCIGTAIIRVSPTFVYSTTGWTTSMSMVVNGCALDVAFHVAMSNTHRVRVAFSAVPPG